MYSFKTFFKLILLSETSGIFPCSKCYFSFWRFLLRCFEFLSYCVDIFVFVIWWNKNTTVILQLENICKYFKEQLLPESEEWGVDCFMFLNYN